MFRWKNNRNSGVNSCSRNNRTTLSYIFYITFTYSLWTALKINSIRHLFTQWLFSMVIIIKSHLIYHYLILNTLISTRFYILITPFSLPTTPSTHLFNARSWLCYPLGVVHWGNVFQIQTFSNVGQVCVRFRLFNHSLRIH